MKYLAAIRLRYSQLSPELRRYLVVGVSIYLFELILIAAAQRMGASDVLAVGISFWAGLTLSFIVQKVLTFGDTRTHYKVLIPQLAAYALLVLFNFGFTVVVTQLLSNLVPAAVSRTIALGITVIWNFYLYKTKIFQRQVEPTSQAKTKKSAKNQPQAQSLSFEKMYAGFAVVVLGATTLWWSWLGARLHQSNADQLVNPQLFESAATWHQAALPGTHSFLLKWPLFFIVKFFDFTDTSYAVVTMACALVTVAVLGFIMWRIERRPYVFAGLCLALSSVLLLVPIQPYAGGLLPVSMAMIATRNLEYAVYLLALLMLCRSTRLRDWRFLVGALLLAVLIASDKLFLSMSAGAALLALVAYSATRQWAWVSQSVRWLFFSILGAVGALVLLSAVDALAIVNLAGQSGASPYGTAGSLKDLALGSLYAVTGILTVMGANPAFDALTIGELPGRFVHHMASEAGAGYIVNLCIVALALFAALNLLWSSVRGGSTAIGPETERKRFAIATLWSALCACVLFVAADHYYVVDARYLAFATFALFISLAVWLSGRTTIGLHVAKLAQIPLLIGVLGGILGAYGHYEAQAKALAPMNARNADLLQILKSHGSQILVGDYWRVIPVKDLSNGKQAVLPLETCTAPRTVLTNTAWQSDLRGKSFAYLLTLDGSLTDFPDCDLKTVTAHFGLPNSSALVSGTLASPKELLLFYDNGIRSGNPSSKQVEHAASVVPVNLDELMKTTCPVPTVMNIVAHQDDDLLFMSPDLLHDVREGHCIRNVYVTAGDAGGGAPYWLSRERGTQAAFDSMLGSPQQWQSKVVRLPQGQYATITTPRHNHKISLIFLHLPDGNLHGEGFTQSRGLSLAHLLDGSAKRLTTVDNQSAYSSQQLIDGLSDLMHTYQPAEVRTQSAASGGPYPDHSDHRTTGRFAKAAVDQYQLEQYGDEPNQIQVPLRYYVGYPIHGFEQNVTGQDLEDKRAAFLAYAQFDPSVCRSRADCRPSPTYGAYLNSQYMNND